MKVVREILIRGEVWRSEGKKGGSFYSWGRGSSEGRRWRNGRVWNASWSREENLDIDGLGDFNITKGDKKSYSNIGGGDAS